MATITQTGGFNPDITTPVSPNANKIGVTGNINGGTASNPANGETAVILGGAGCSNANIGGLIYRQTGQSSNQFPISPATVQTGNTGGGAGQSDVFASSSNPLAIQEQVISRIETETVAQTTLANISGPGQGEIIDFPKSTKTASFGSSSSIASNVTLNNQTNSNAYVGITENKTFIVDELERLAQERLDVQSTNVTTGGRIDGAAQGADDVDKFQLVTGSELSTPSIRETLPGGVLQSQLIENPALDNNFPPSSGTTTPGSY